MSSKSSITSSHSSSSSSSSTSKLKPTAPPVSRAQTNLSRSTASSSQSLHSSTSDTQSQQSTVRAASIRRSTSSNEILTENIDDFALGDRVWVNGQRPGIIKFLGETQFAPGKWSGIELETDEGKNDGSIGGVRYFRCLPKFGVFVRPQRLTKLPIEDSVSLSPRSNKSSPAKEMPPPLSPLSVDKLMYANGKNNGLHGKFQVGDRVLVNATSGTKLGTLLFLGEADFATGFWAGIELDEPIGKNDGSVAGKRYFKCEMKYGLFAPIHKISAAPLSAIKISKKSKRPSVSRQRSGSQESLNSVSSTASSTYRQNRIRLGVTSLSSKGSKSSSQQLAANVSSASSAINEALKEKEDHISQLLKERDLERGEVARAAAQADMLEERLGSLQSEHNKIVQEADEEITELKRLNTEYEDMQSKLSAQLEDEKKKLEDLQFRLEEETIMRSELDSQVISLKEEIDRLKLEIKSSLELSSKSNSEQVEVLISKLKHSDSQREMDVFKLQEDLVHKEEQVFQLEASIEKRNIDLSNLQQRVLEFEQELEAYKQRNDRQLESIDVLNLRIKKEEDNKRSFLEDNELLKKQLLESDNKLRLLEERMEDMTSGQREMDSVGKRVIELEKELRDKEDIERALEERLLETKSRYENFEDEISSLAEQLTKMRELCDQEIKRRIDAEDKCNQLLSLNHSLENQIQDLIKTSGSNSDLMIKLNTEFVERQKGYAKREQSLKDEANAIRKEKEVRDVEIKNLKIDIEDKMSRITKFEKKERDIDKQLQINENELKLTRNDCEEKQKVVNDLRQQLNEMKTNLSIRAREQENSRGDLEFQISRLEKNCADHEQELNAVNQELRKLRDLNFDLEIERDRYKRDSERFEKLSTEKQQLIDNMRRDVQQMKDEFNKYRSELESQLDDTKTNSDVLVKIGIDLDKQRQQCRDIEDDNQSLRDDNRHLREKVEELRDDIEAMEKRHSEVLAEFEFECERLQHKTAAAEQLADDRQQTLTELEAHQNVAIDNFRRAAETEKRQLERKLDELEVKVRESIASANVRRYAIDEGRDNYEQQIEFLNSVIVDMQKKNDELKARNQVLEEIGLAEFDTSLTPRTTVNGHIRTPRLFCDICDQFDVHDTEDCPKQSSIEQEFRNHTYYHASRHEERPYCGICEMFGHLSANCPQNDTF